jgi:hypothetical protein
VSFSLVRSAVLSVWSPPVLRVVPGGMTARMTAPGPWSMEIEPGAFRSGDRNGPETERGHTQGETDS